MKKIAIFGPPASGKSTLASRLGKTLDIPVYYLDQYRWQQNWKKRPKDQFLEMHSTLCSQSEWIIEGLYSSTYKERVETADTIVYLALPRLSYFWNLIKRFWSRNTKTPIGYPRSCKPRFNWDFIKYCWSFNKNYNAQITALLKQHEENKKIYIISSQKELTKFMHTLKHSSTHEKLL